MLRVSAPPVSGLQGNVLWLLATYSLKRCDVRREHSLQPAASSRSETDAEDENTAKKLAAPIGLVVGLAVLLGAGFLFKGQIRGFVDYFITVVDDLGPLGCAQQPMMGVF